MEALKQEYITVTLTSGQLEDLVRCMYLAQWMINGIHTEDEKNNRYEQLEQYVYALAKREGVGDIIEFLEDQKKFALKDEFVETNDVEQYRRKYDDEIFWSELIQRLTVRDVVNQWGLESLSSVGTREEVERRQPFLRKYIEEFEKNGVQNLVIKEPVL
ncbi:MAG: hypothetical protein AAB400_02230 [Patescibacteria group bacterium]